MPLPAALLENRWPAIEWREPLPVKWPDADVYSCRICIAEHGLKRSSNHQWASAEEARTHIKEEH